MIEFKRYSIIVEEGLFKVIDTYNIFNEELYSSELLSDSEGYRDKLNLEYSKLMNT